MGDVDISYAENGTRIGPFKDTPSPTRTKIIAAMTTAVQQLALDAKPVIVEPVQSSDRFMVTAPFGTFAQNTSGRVTDCAFNFKDGPVFLVQLAERDIGWSPEQHVGLYWGLPFMQVSVGVQGGALIGQREPEGPALVNIRRLLRDAKGLPVTQARFILGDFLTMLETLLSKDISALPPALTAKSPAWKPAWSTDEGRKADQAAFKVWGDTINAQEVAMMELMPSLSGLQHMPRAERNHDANKPRQEVVRDLRKREPPRRPCTRPPPPSPHTRNSSLDTPHPPLPPPHLQSCGVYCETRSLAKSITMCQPRAMC